MNKKMGMTLPDENIVKKGAQVNSFLFFVCFIKQVQFPNVGQPSRAPK